jgi:pilus assembly protein CpaD
MHFSSSKTRPALAAVALALLIGAGTDALAKKPFGELRGLEPVNQPVVQRTDFVFDATPDGYNGLAREEQLRIRDWFDAIDLRYGDRVTIAEGGLYAHSAAAEAVENLVKRYGLLLAGEAPRTAGEAPSGALRIVVSRATASVPACPNWGDKMEMDTRGGMSFNYGCATNGNLAAMIANPEDLVTGRDTKSELRVVKSTSAVKAYNQAPPSGGGGSLK